MILASEHRQRPFNVCDIQRRSGPATWSLDAAVPSAFADNNSAWGLIERQPAQTARYVLRVVFVEHCCADRAFTRRGTSIPKRAQSGLELRLTSTCPPYFDFREDKPPRGDVIFANSPGIMARRAPAIPARTGEPRAKEDSPGDTGCDPETRFRYRHTLMVTVFTSVYCCSAYSPISLPIPDCLKPPKGAAASKTSKQFTQTVPALTLFAINSAF